jgi:FMN phosphatase YigB (HAD superfamily)
LRAIGNGRKRAISNIGVRVLKNGQNWANKAQKSTIEVDYINHFRKEKLIDGAAELLQYLHNKNYRIFILSNSLFSGSSLKAYLGSFHISHYVEKVYSSADIGYRKPSCIIFQTVLHDLGMGNNAEQGKYRFLHF